MVLTGLNKTEKYGAHCSLLHLCILIGSVRSGRSLNNLSTTTGAIIMLQTPESYERFSQQLHQTYSISGKLQASGSIHFLKSSQTFMSRSYFTLAATGFFMLVHLRQSNHACAIVGSNNGSSVPSLS